MRLLSDLSVGAAPALSSYIFSHFLKPSGCSLCWWTRLVDSQGQALQTMIAGVLRCALEVEGSPYHVLVSSGDQPSSQRMLVVWGLPCGRTMVTSRPGGTPAGYDMTIKFCKLGQWWVYSCWDTSAKTGEGKNNASIIASWKVIPYHISETKPTISWRVGETAQILFCVMGFIMSLQNDDALYSVWLHSVARSKKCRFSRQTDLRLISFYLSHWGQLDYLHFYHP